MEVGLVRTNFMVMEGVKLSVEFDDECRVPCRVISFGIALFSDD